MQVPGFTHPVTDIYLDEILPLIGFQSSGSFRKSSSSQKNDPGKLSQAQQGLIDETIFDTFLNATEEAFDVLLEVCASSVLQISQKASCTWYLPSTQILLVRCGASYRQPYCKICKDKDLLIVVLYDKDSTTD